jgi:endogenous inhibitor of DNA gyrase (YacG/DUF329 family)
MSAQQSGDRKVVRTIACPACGGPSRYASDNAFRPFCSQRCRNLDLGAWASERYRVDASSSRQEDRTDPPEESR